MIERLKGHEIVCGWGRMGHSVVQELRRGQRPFVVIEKNPDKARRLREDGIYVVEADATSEAALLSAGVHRARGLVACLNLIASALHGLLTSLNMQFPGLKK